ncbi:MAG TPA: hypothetical protein VFX59_10935 [Polyangiales bacterium]|nr:hypothetical protein [Polyangiales bacterium]
MISGAAIEDARQCLGAREELGCVAADTDCDEAHTAARDPAGRPWWLNDSCMPAGFTALSGANVTSYSLCDEEPCAAKDAAGCALDSRCMPIAGSLVDEPRQCIGESKPLACVERQACDAALLVADDTEGRTWWFASGCLPPGFRNADGGDPAVNYPPCSAQPDTCQAKSVDACKLDARCVVISANRVERERRCIGAAVDVGCDIAEARWCGDAHTIAADASGQPYWFGTTCIATNLTYLSPTTGSPQAEWASYPRCDALPSR